jgi:acyl carrier protein
LKAGVTKSAIGNRQLAIGNHPLREFPDHSELSFRNLSHRPDTQISLLRQRSRAGDATMSTDEIRATIKKSIAAITSLSPEEITDSASYKDDLQLDSLTILEIAVDAEYQFQVKIPDEVLSEIRTVDDTVRIVQQHLQLAVA